ncbi:MAG: flagellar M-ring protein FliF [Bryobacterales bacterium]|nr:flagellar M-ring protein FliF [Bryobacterales bacterium]
MLEQIKRLVNSLSRKQQILIAVAGLAVASGLALFLHQTREKDFRPLFTALAPEDAGQVVAKLKEANVEYRLSEGGSVVLVRSARVADSRLLVASVGLPKSGRIGFEIFDKTNFGATDFSEKVNYGRALEGELERTVMALTEVEQARVHISFLKDSVFTESRQPAKASILLKLKPGARLSPRNVSAIEHLVANAVEGLSPEGVTVVDMQGNLLNSPPKNPETGDVDGPIEYRQKIERDMLAKINATLAPILGADHFHAGISVDVDFSSGEQSEETWDPNRSVMVNQQRSEETSAPVVPSGTPGAASSLPRPTSRPGSSTSQMTRRTENVTYQSSRVVRKTRLPQGAIRRLSVSTIVDQNVRWEGTGKKAKRVLEPPSEETLKKVRDLVAGAIGFNQERGDQIVVQTLPFESTLRVSPPPDPSAPASPQKPGGNSSGLERWLAEKNIKVNPMVLYGVAGGVLFLLLGGGYFLIARRRKAAAKAAAEHAAAELTEGDGSHAQDHQLPAVTEGQPYAEGTLEEKLEKHLAERESARLKAEMEVLHSLQAPNLSTKKSEVLVKHIAEQAKRDPAMIAQIVRTWLQDREGHF